jgi:hypothetical protein
MMGKAEQKKEFNNSKMNVDFDGSEEDNEGTDYEGGSEDFWKASEQAGEEQTKIQAAEELQDEAAKEKEEDMEDEEDPCCWEVYEGNVKIISDNSSITRLAFISLSDQSVISKLPDFSYQQVTIDKTINS